VPIITLLCPYSAIAIENFRPKKIITKDAEDTERTPVLIYVRLCWFSLNWKTAGFELATKDDIP